MSRKVDLNAPRNSQNDYKKSRNNHSFSHGITSIDNSVSNNDSLTKDDDNNVSGASNFNNVNSRGGRRILGGLAGINSVNNIDTDDEIKAIIRIISPKVKFGLVALIVGLVIVLMMAFIVLFSDGQTVESFEDLTTLVKNCGTVIVVNTGCDENESNCTHEYDGEVAFEDYVAGAVAGISDGANNEEFYKVMSIVTRTIFLENLSTACQISGNVMTYKSIDEAIDKNMIKSAVKETNKMVLTDSNDKVVKPSYSMACVVNNANNSYYLRYGINENNYQKIDASFDSDNQIYRGKLNTLYNTIDKSDNTLDNRVCPSGNDSSGLSLIGALYLATNENYDYEKILNYYYGDISVVTAQGTFNGNQVDGFINPVSNFYRCTSSFGCRVHPISGGYRYHNGIDIPVVEGTPVYAAKAGKITAVRTDVTGYLAGSYGNYIDVDHMDGTRTRYAHLKYGGVMVSVGMMVNQGQPIALSGNTGGSTGPHLHYEVHVNGVPVDPYNYIDTSVIGNAGSCNYGESVPASYCGR